MTTSITDPVADLAASTGRVTHLVCPNQPEEPPQRAICGYVCHDRRPHGPRCIVCLDLASQPCPDCREMHDVGTT